MERKFNSAFNHIINYVSFLPYIYRYENKEFIDKFFDKGELFISSFHNYKKYEDNQLGDKTEGSTINFGNTENKMTFSTVTTVGLSEYCFCTSTMLDKKLLEKFSRNGVFRIKDPISFILEITRSLERVIEVCHGQCMYVDKKMIVRNIPTVTMDDLKNEEGSISFEKLMSVSNYIQGLDSFFAKKRDYQEQSEYRILWKTDRNITQGIIINCPEAIKHCEKINDDEI